MATENFPALPAMPHALVKIPAAVLEEPDCQNKFAISMEESRYTLNGGLLILKPDTLAMVATDGHRLALAETDQKLDSACSACHCGPRLLFTTFHGSAPGRK